MTTPGGAYVEDPTTTAPGTRSPIAYSADHRLYLCGRCHQQLPDGALVHGYYDTGTDNLVGVVAYTDPTDDPIHACGDQTGPLPPAIDDPIRQGRKVDRG